MTTFSPINTFNVNVPHSKNIRTQNKSEDTGTKPDEQTKPAGSEAK